MKSYFIRLFNYDLYTNNLINGLLIKQDGDTAHAVKLMAHMLTTPQTWLKRCKQTAPHGLPVWPDLPKASFADMIAANHRDWVAFINSLERTDFDKVIQYQTSIGLTYDNVLVDIITHVINHGTHTRAQIGQHLKLAGLEKLPVTDYAIWRREQPDTI
jgi:uncharacterized damage-inducible protein DinB